MDSWRDNTPRDFVFTLKMNRLVTHQKKLNGVNGLLAQFFDRARRLEEKLGVILHQLPPSVRKDLPLLSFYLELLPREMKHAVEFRHESWSCDETFDLLRSQGVAYCIISAPKLETHIRTTAPFAYIRMHGKGGWYASCYSEGELKGWSQEIVKLAKEGCDGYVYFNNDYGAYAAHNAFTLRRQLDHPSRRHILSVA